jgi:hypothetical protein
MIVKIKTFSGETLYIPEEDYLQELMFSDGEVYDEEEYEPELEKADKKAIKKYQKHPKRLGRQLQLYDEDPQVRRRASRKKALKKSLIGTAAGGILGYAYGEDQASKNPNFSNKRIAGSTLLGSALGAGVTYGLSRLNDISRERKFKKHPYTEKNLLVSRDIDRKKVANGNMTESEFKKKWYIK